MLKWTQLVFLAVFVAVGLLLYNSLEKRVSRSEAIVQEVLRMDRSYVVVKLSGSTRVFTRLPSELANEWAIRSRRAMDGEESMEGYNCTVLKGCSGGEEIEVCTPCPVGTPAEECEATHAEEVAAFCRVFECDC